MTAPSAPAVPPPEFSRPVPVDLMAGPQLTREIAAGPDECRALAARFGLVAIDHLKATVRLRRLDGGRMVRVTGSLTAAVVQTCVVSLDPVPASVAEDFSALFVPAEHMPDPEAELVFDAQSLDDDLPEPMTAGIIDIGELTAQHLSLALDPYPRHPDAAFPGYDDDLDDTEAPAAKTPFEALARLKRQH